MLFCVPASACHLAGDVQVPLLVRHLQVDSVKQQHNPLLA
jgi:hypothetical protein